MGACWTLPSRLRRAFSYQIDSVTDFDIDSDTCQEYVVVNRKGRDIHVLSHNLESSPAHGENTPEAMLPMSPPKSGPVELSLSQCGKNTELSLMSSRIEQKNKGDKIEGVLRKEFPRLADEIDPEAVARYLYGLSIIDRSELELAMVKSTKQTDRSSRLLLHLIRKLKANPNWCDDAIVALRKAGVNTESITVALEDAGISEPDDVDKGDRCGQTVTSIQDPNNQDKQVGRDDLHSQRMQAKQPDRIEQIEQLPPTESDVHVSGQNKNDVLGQNEEAVLVNHDQDMYRHRYHHSNSRCVMPESSHGSAALREVPQTSYCAILKEHIDDLRDESAIIDDKDGDRNTCLHVAAIEGNDDAVKQLLKIDPDSISNQNMALQTPLHLCIQNGHVSVTLLLCGYRNCYPYLLDKDRKTVLHYACSSGNTNLVKPVLKLCSEPRFVNARDCHGDTGLHIATRKRFTDIVKLLLQSKANLDIKNKLGQIPMDIAKQNRDAKAINKLKKGSRFRGLQMFRSKGASLKRSSTVATLPTCQSMQSISSQTTVASELVVRDDTSSIVEFQFQ